MSDWQFKLDLKDSWKKCNEGEMSVVDLSKVVVERIKALIVEIRERGNNPKDVVDRMISKKLLVAADDLENEVLPQFEEIVESENEDESNFDSVLADLYDWADTKLDSHWNGRRMCWVATEL